MPRALFTYKDCGETLRYFSLFIPPFFFLYIKYHFSQPMPKSPEKKELPQLVHFQTMA